eukprot:323830-Pyramimonas_sp.AAC.1
MASMLEDSDESSGEELGIIHLNDAEVSAKETLEQRNYHELLTNAFQEKTHKLRCPFNYPNEHEEILCKGNNKYPTFSALQAHARADAAKPDDEGRHRILLDMMDAIEATFKS